MSTFNDLKSDDFYKKLLEKLPEDERKKIEESIQKLLTDFDSTILTALKNIK